MDGWNLRVASKAGSNGIGQTTSSHGQLTNSKLLELPNKDTSACVDHFQYAGVFGKLKGSHILYTADDIAARMVCLERATPHHAWKPTSGQNWTRIDPWAAWQTLNGTWHCLTLRAAPTRQSALPRVRFAVHCRKKFHPINRNTWVHI